MKTLIIDAASIDSMYTIHDRFIAAFDFAECYGETAGFAARLPL